MVYVSVIHIVEMICALCQTFFHQEIEYMLGNNSQKNVIVSMPMKQWKRIKDIFESVVHLKE